VPGTGGPVIGIPNWVPARFEEIDLIFEQASVREVIANKIPYGANVDWARGAEGAYSVMEPGGTFRIHIWGAEAHIEEIAQMFRDAGFSNVETLLKQIIMGKR
jgi:hypothetical protein